MINAVKKVITIINKFIFNHKIISLIIILCFLGGGYWIYKSVANTNGETHYVLGEVSKGTIISSISGTGQTVALNELDIKPKTSGDLTTVVITGGQTIERGQLIAKIDTTDARLTVANAQKALDQANIDLEKMGGVQTDLGKLRGVTEKAQDTLNAAYESGFNTVTNAFLNLPTVMTGLQNILYGNTYNNIQQNLDYYAGTTGSYNPSKKSAENSYQIARTAYDKSYTDFKTTSRTSSKVQIESIIGNTYDAIGKISQSVKDSINLIQFYQDELTKQNITPASASNTHLSSLSSYVTTTNSYLTSLLSIKTSIETDKENLIQTGYDISDQTNLVADKKAALDDANKNLSYCYIYAPFSGVVSAVNVKVGDSVSSGTSIAKIVTKDVAASISLNEVDAAKISLDQKVIITFDAISDLSITGKVSGIDTLGTVSQGVVSYNTEISFDTQDSRVKPGMSVSANIITETKQNVLMVPNSAVKTKNGNNYVLIPDKKQSLNSSLSNQGFVFATAPAQKTVEIGISDDTNTEIVSGLSEGDQVVARTVSNTKTTTTSTSQNTNRAAQGMFGVGGPGR